MHLRERHCSLISIDAEIPKLGVNPVVGPDQERETRFEPVVGLQMPRRRLLVDWWGR